MDAGIASLRIAGIPETKVKNDTNAAAPLACDAIKVDSPVQPIIIAVSHLLGRPTERNVIVKFATRNVVRDGHT